MLAMWYCIRLSIPGNGFIFKNVATRGKIASGMPKKESGIYYLEADYERRKAIIKEHET